MAQATRITDFISKRVLKALDWIIFSKLPNVVEFIEIKKQRCCVHFLGPVSPCYGCLVKLGVILYQIADTLVLLTSLLLGFQHSKASFLSAFNLYF